MAQTTEQQETRTGLFIAGQELEAEGDFPVFDPSDPEVVVGHAAAASAEQARDAVQAAHGAFPGWAELGAQKRSELVVASLDALEEGKDERVELLSRENGKVRSECEIDMIVMANRFKVAPTHAALLDEVRKYDPPPFRTEVERVPMGVVSVIVPFNWPLAILAASLPQALIAGNTAVIKAPPSVPLSFVGTMSRIAAALPPGVLNVISGRDEEIGPVMIQDPLVKKVCFTGSVGAGKRIMAMASESVTPVTLELGGNDPALVLADAELDDETVQKIAVGTFLTTGQVCMAIKRLYVHRSHYDALVEGVSGFLEHTRLGRGLDPETTMGPLHTDRQRDFVSSLLSEAQAKGAEVREFGDPVEGELERGHFLRPALVLDPPDDAGVVTEEQFGPALPILPFDDEEDAIARANGTWSGLCSSVWSADLDHAGAVAGRLRTGTTFVNGHNGPHLDDRSPFGGFEQSGIGREMGVEGMLEFTHAHSITYAG
jgi:acyl-CoA reductase-like NAD-dependent aldehyde dehydrogenase